MVAVPARPAVTRPNAFTRATSESELDQLKMTLGSALLAASNARAVKVTVSPAMSARVAGVTVTEATGAAATAVAVNTAGDPLTPGTRASAVCAPTAAPSVNRVCDCPDALVVAVPGLTLPPPAVTTHCTVCPLTALPC